MFSKSFALRLFLSTRLSIYVLRLPSPLPQQYLCINIRLVSVSSSYEDSIRFMHSFRLLSVPPLFLTFDKRNVPRVLDVWYVYECVCVCDGIAREECLRRDKTSKGKKQFRDFCYFFSPFFRFVRSSVQMKKRIKMNTLFLFFTTLDWRISLSPPLLFFNCFRFAFEIRFGCDFFPVCFGLLHARIFVRSNASAFARIHI